LWFKPAVPGFGSNFGEVGNELYFTGTTSEAGQTSSYYLFSLWFILCALIFVLISQCTAKFFRLLKPLEAYTLDIAGSCCGIAVFMIFSWYKLPAFVWFIFIIPFFVYVMNRSSRWAIMTVVGSFIVIVALAFVQDTRPLSNPNFKGTFESEWSPYQKVEYLSEPGRLSTIHVNGTPHQSLRDKIQLGSTFYELPYLMRTLGDQPMYERALIIGSGAGNDVAMSLKYEVKHIDAVDIDPTIVSYGRKYHPLKPYADSRVNVIIDDGRAVLTRSEDKYDLILYALTDSIIRVSPMSQLRLENYLFTVESAARAYELLNEGGDLIFYNFYRTQWLTEKISAMIYEAVGRTPAILSKSDDLVVFMVRKKSALETTRKRNRQNIDVPTDDWPFLYLKAKGIPFFYVKAMAAVAVSIVLLLGLYTLFNRGKKNAEGTSGLPAKVAFAFMGAAFLLLETKSITQFSLLFGTTWINTSFVFLAILLLVLAANWTALIFRGHVFLLIASGLLILSCVLSVFYPLANLLYFEDKLLRFFFASLLVFSPIFFANLIFSVHFRDQKIHEQLFGWNLVGSTLGGVLEYSSMALGYSNLAIVVTFFYVIVLALFAWDNRIHSHRSK